MEHSPSIAGLRAELGLTLAEMGDRCGISKSQMHEVEKTGRAALRVALAIEDLSEGRVDAGALCEDVRLSRHAVMVTAGPAAPSPGKSACEFPASGEAA